MCRHVALLSNQSGRWGQPQLAQAFRLRGYAHSFLQVATPI